MATMRLITRPLVAVAVAVFAATGGAAAQALAPAGAKGTLTVEYLYDHTGQAFGKERQDRWRVKRSVQIEAQLVAGKPGSAPTMQPLDALQLGKIDQQRAQFDKLNQAMAPTMAGVQALMAKCGSDDVCMEREGAKLAMAMAGTQDKAAMQNLGRETSAAMTKDAALYQVWSGVSQRGRYTIDETLQHKVVDPLCHKRPGLLCTHDTRREGGGELPAAASSLAAVEVDLRTNKLALRLPIPAGTLPFSQTTSTDEPQPNGKPPAPKTETAQFVLRTTADGKIASEKALVVPLSGGTWRSQSGEQVVALAGAGAEGGKLVVRWRFTAR
jgi:hypothetical protein